MTRAVTFGLALLAAATGARGQDIKPAAERLAAAWQKADVDALGGQAARAGLSLDVDGERVGPVAGRQAATILKRVFDERETMSTDVGSAREMHGEGRRAFVELVWVTRSRGTSIPDSSTVLFSLEYDRDQWRITEIRLMR